MTPLIDPPLSRNVFEKERQASEKEHKAVVKAFEEERRKRETEHAVVVKALDDEREGRTTEHNEAVKWRRISIAVTVILGSMSIYLGYLAL